MNYREFQKKWVTGETRDISINIANAETKGECKALHRVSEAPLGDFLREYIKHVTKPRWRRGSDYKFLRDRMEAVLNEISFEFMED